MIYAVFYDLEGRAREKKWFKWVNQVNQYALAHGWLYSILTD